MDKIIIRGGKRLSGAVPVSGAKNSALTLLPCALLTDEPVTLRNLPRLADIDGFQHLMNQFGVSTSIAGARPEDFGRVMTLQATRLTSTVAPYDLVRKMRASILVLGPMLARAGEATVSLPGGCAIGNRPIDLHLKALEALGAQIELAAGYVRAIAPDGGLPGGRYSFPVVSVGATENALMAAVLAKGKSTLHNAAREPEIVDLCNLLVAMGAQIEGIGTSDLTIHGVDRLHGATYMVMPDRIEAGSYACAAAITGGEVMLNGARIEDMEATVQALRDAGVHVEPRKGGIYVAADGPLKPVTISTAPYPGFATDMQAQLMAMLCLAHGSSVLTETIFENRYMHVPELNRMGARIETKGRTAVVHGVEKLTGAEVMATDLRASMSLVIAGLAAEGETQVHRLYHLDRGYERLEEKLSLLGAEIERVGGD
ncbi:UDP-N-acetylglucosamine 1-carboxyvinyltransferase [Novosphingobium aromaticivorans DSM 12444]|uniref:UDP-N-acetylglucosamine 1-carboxyvinyltransferase n=1 Tax=Novosphingobium aromaticivorans (strain ATCC 700278 / DSM 12444 / CCUG 56034 / CIP 105152 / NBRC 16084 / F199) TaxID=279238 RepID=MURA_NOVAD|nr:UDP-N-acetylglucosamine 1-carboxyvinyltransferase [Novosphingobium aromaticivorans]Q2GB76.1 RecName: Full=UDP-N-acetylglucosamine 1-carboxyvinyltransferase; AltName: Full=Enoylpyruvate transferase; AltName: Full=UDP-N-acetylglucosamine enolpyruvyl transferase; Short=EPT [Novosphingobium aromaticivorans DSM 12444]ABD24897.1 UDP-N-acetylglucosamine 1-carboxyvinyltransferase [Novosphingobium aromaticivorans DSM 12444]SCY14184.1 UDP-N-acetylglucosamine 1-carboxyvinyltransferase [Novosphingobium a